jgi:hypothetical protein
MTQPNDQEQAFLFKITSKGDSTILASFQNLDPSESNPGRLTEGNNGSLYGTVWKDGPGGGGFIFRLDLPPTITNQPVSRFNGLGTTASFSVAATGTSPFNYQWVRNGTNLFDGGNISGANSSMLALSNVQPENAGAFSVIVSNIAGTATSTTATLSVLQGSESAIASFLTSTSSPTVNTLRFAAVPGTEHVVQFATNLTDSPWFTISTNIADTFGAWTVTDSTATNAQRFYRTVTP